MMKEKFKEYIKEFCLVNETDKILLAVSGGIDSMVMAHLFTTCNYRTGIAHCNFGLRGEESDLDELLVRKYSESNGIPFFCKSFKTKEYARDTGISIQMAARDLRYKWFDDIRKDEGYDLIAIAHNLNDVVETFLINLSRGTGIAGLTGIKTRQNKIIRPLLFATRTEIAAYLEQYRIPFREDRSNSETNYKRNKLRHSVIPLFREINPSFDNTIIDTARRFEQLNDLLDNYVGALENKAMESGNGITIFNPDTVSEELRNPTLLFELFRKFGVGSSQIVNYRNLLQQVPEAFYTLIHTGLSKTGRR